jgi:AcrR family transcriptional regulator
VTATTGPPIATSIGPEARASPRVAAAAGIDHSTLYHHFATKQDLIVAVVELATRPLRSTMPDAAPA